MTETDTSRNKLHRLIGQLSHDYACDLEREASDVIVALLARAEKAEADLEKYHKCGIVEIAAMNPSVMGYMRHWEGRAEKAETGRDTAWDDAIEAASRYVDEMRFSTRGAAVRGILSLKKGDKL